MLAVQPSYGYGAPMMAPAPVMAPAPMMMAPAPVIAPVAPVIAVPLAHPKTRAYRLSLYIAEGFFGGVFAINLIHLIIANVVPTLMLTGIIFYTSFTGGVDGSFGGGWVYVVVHFMSGPFGLWKDTTGMPHELESSVKHFFGEGIEQTQQRELTTKNLELAAQVGQAQNRLATLPSGPFYDAFRGIIKCCSANFFSSSLTLLIVLALILFCTSVARCTEIGRRDLDLRKFSPGVVTMTFLLNILIIMAGSLSASRLISVTKACNIGGVAIGPAVLVDIWGVLGMVGCCFHILFTWFMLPTVIEEDDDEEVIVGTTQQVAYA
ncbi:unnamed protein product [Amoebophrya sp. A25]|nr:unnamed protein product [Amoebophrya sp. A25]|eukprot:GSA25T00027044001.1